jgi:hypothetical protein
LRTESDGLDERLARCPRELAKKQHLSLNRAALELMRRGAGLTNTHDPSGAVGSTLDKFIGVWSEEDEAELLEALEPFEQIDTELWS